MIPGILEAMDKIIKPENPLLLQYYGELRGAGRLRWLHVEFLNRYRL